MTIASMSLWRQFANAGNLRGNGRVRSRARSDIWFKESREMVYAERCLSWIGKHCFSWPGSMNSSSMHTVNGKTASAFLFNSELWADPISQQNRPWRCPNSWRRGHEFWHAIEGKVQLKGSFGVVPSSLRIAAKRATWNYSSNRLSRSLW